MIEGDGGREREREKEWRDTRKKREGVKGRSPTTICFRSLVVIERDEGKRGKEMKNKKEDTQGRR